MFNHVNLEFYLLMLITNQNNLLLAGHKRLWEDPPLHCCKKKHGVLKILTYQKDIKIFRYPELRFILIYVGQRIWFFTFLDWILQGRRLWWSVDIIIRQVLRMKAKINLKKNTRLMSSNPILHQQRLWLLQLPMQWSYGSSKQLGSTELLISPYLWIFLQKMMPKQSKYPAQEKSSIHIYRFLISNNNICIIQCRNSRFLKNTIYIYTYIYHGMANVVSFLTSFLIHKIDNSW